MSDEQKESYDIQAVLLEMREKYWQGLAEAEETPEEQLECLTFDLGGETFAFETVHAAEVIRIPRLVKIPKVQTHFVGVFNLRVITCGRRIRPLPTCRSSNFLPPPNIWCQSEVFLRGSRRDGSGSSGPFREQP